MKKTEWYPASVKPVRSGWYEAKYDGCLPSMTFEQTIEMRWFDGEAWRLYPHTDPAGCMFGHPEFSDQWRGLTEKAA